MKFVFRISGSINLTCLFVLCNTWSILNILLLIFSLSFLNEFFHTGNFQLKSGIKRKNSRYWKKKKEKRSKKEKKNCQIIFLRYSCLKGCSVKFPLIHNKRSFLKPFCLAYIKSSHQKLEASCKRCFSEISVCRKARSLL